MIFYLRIHELEHFKKKYGVDEVFFTDEVIDFNSSSVYMCTSR